MPNSLAELMLYFIEEQSQVSYINGEIVTQYRHLQALLELIGNNAEASIIKAHLDQGKQAFQMGWSSWAARVLTFGYVASDECRYRAFLDKITPDVVKLLESAQSDDDFVRLPDVVVAPPTAVDSTRLVVEGVVKPLQTAFLSHAERRAERHAAQAADRRSRKEKPQDLLSTQIQEIPAYIQHEIAKLDQAGYNYKIAWFILKLEFMATLPVETQSEHLIRLLEHFNLLAQEFPYLLPKTSSHVFLARDPSGLVVGKVAARQLRENPQGLLIKLNERVQHLRVDLSETIKAYSEEKRPFSVNYALLTLSLIQWQKYYTQLPAFAIEARSASARARYAL